MTRFLTFLLCGLALTLVACSSQDPQSEMTSLTLALDWVPNTNHTGLYVAQDLGYFAQEGININIQQPSEDSSSTIVATGRADLGIYFQPNMVKRLVKGQPITAIAAINQHNTAGLMSLKSLGATSPSDLAGMRYSTWEDKIDDATVAQMVGGPLVPVPGEALDAVSALRLGMFDYILAYYGWDGINAEVKNIPINFFLLRDADPAFDYYSPIIIAGNAFLQENPEAAKKALRAIEKGYRYAAEHPQEAADILVKYAPETNRQLAQKSQIYLSQQYLAEDGTWGYMDPNRWDRFFNWVYDNHLVDAPFAPSAGMTNDYLSPQGD